MIVECVDRFAMARHMKGLGGALARRINNELGRKGQVITRYHLQPLTNPTQVRNAVAYVLHNHKHHEPSRYLIDDSSGPWFTGWKTPVKLPPSPPPVRAARTWMLRTGWWLQGGGGIGLEERPRS